MVKMAEVSLIPSRTHCQPQPNLDYKQVIVDCTASVAETRQS